MDVDGRTATVEAALTLRIGGFSKRGRQILGPVELIASAGTTVALVGPSGVGKTTLLRLMAGLETIAEGACVAAGRVAMVFQEPTLLAWRSLTDNLCLTTQVSRPEAETLLARVGLDGRGDDYPGQLSLGQQRRVALARAFARRPNLLLLDEPFVSLDPETALGMMRLFAGLRREMRVSTILVTHARAEAEMLADRIVTLGGTPGRILSDRPNTPADP